MALYTDIVMDHFMNPRNVGSIENADGVGEVGNAKCGDIMKMDIKVENDVITDVKFKTFTARCSPKRPSNPLSRITTTRTASPTTRKSSLSARTASPAGWCKLLTTVR